jgi:hypothetical protein
MFYTSTFFYFTWLYTGILTIPRHKPKKKSRLWRDCTEKTSAFLLLSTLPLKRYPATSVFTVMTHPVLYFFLFCLCSELLRNKQHVLCEVKQAIWKCSYLSAFNLHSSNFSIHNLKMQAREENKSACRAEGVFPKFTACWFLYRFCDVSLKVTTWRDNIFVLNNITFYGPFDKIYIIYINYHSRT